MSSRGGSTVVSRGVSLNFDAEGLVYDDEAEYQKEDEQQQHELRQLLTEFSDLSEDDDDNDSNLSQDQEVLEATGDPGLVGSNHTVSHPQAHSDMRWPRGPVAAVSSSAQTSTPKVGQPPPLSTPSTTTRYAPPDAIVRITGDQPKAQQALRYDADTFNEEKDVLSVSPPPPLQAAVREPHWMPSTLPAHDSLTEHQRGETEGGNDMQHNFAEPHTAVNPYYNVHPVVDMEADVYGTQPSGNGFVGFNGNNQQTITNAFQPAMHSIPQYNLAGQVVYGLDNVPTQTPNGFHGYTDQHVMPGYVPIHTGHYQSDQLPTSPPSRLLPSDRLNQQRQDSLENYKVQYAKNKPLSEEREIQVIDAHRMKNDGEFLDGKDPATMPRPTTPGGEPEEEKIEFFKQTNQTAEGHQVAQLRILYEARGRRLDELDQEHKTFTEETEREIRILKHRLTLSEDERNGLSASLENSKDLLQESKREESQLQGQIKALQTQVHSLTATKEEIIKKLDMAESTIENLNTQLAELEGNESLTRARQQHDSIVNGMQQKHEKQMLLLKEKIDELNNQNKDKGEELTKLKKQILNQVKAGEEANIDRADTINRLTKSLEESQRQCSELLEAGAGQEVSKLKIQLQDVIGGKSIAEDMSNALQSEINELKEQITMYESASQYGVFSSTGVSTSNLSVQKHNLEDSYAQLNIKKVISDIGTPTSARSDASSNLTVDETVTGLKAELERCLHNYKAKRLLVEQLQGDLKSTKAELEEVRRKLEDSERLFSDAKVKLKKLEEDMTSIQGTGLSVVEGRLQREVESLKKEKQLHIQEIQELNCRLEEIAQSEELVKDVNRELSGQMAEMVREFDEDKKQALKKCQEVCLQHHDSAKERFQKELHSAYTEEKNNIIQKNKEGIEALRSELNVVQKELDEAKSLYVSVCQAKDKLEDNLNKQWQEKVDSEIQKIKDKLSKEKENELLKLKLNLTAEHEAAISTSKERLLKDNNDDLQRKLEIEIAKIKVDWSKEQVILREEAVKSALSKRESEWEKQLEDQLKEAREASETQKKVEIEAEVSKRLDVLQAVLESKAQEPHVESKLEDIRAKWEKDLQTKIDEEKTKWEQMKKEELDKKVAEVEGRLQEVQQVQVEVRLQEAREKWAAESRREKELALKAASLQSQQHLQGTIVQVQEESTKVRNEKERLEHELSAARHGWLEERQKLIEQKDAERRKVIEEIQDQNETDYREFLKEHQDTLDKILKGSKEQFAKEKEQIEKRHKQELKQSKEKCHKNVELERQLAEEKVELEKRWTNKLESLTEEHEKEKEELMKLHRDNLKKALEEARAKWQQKYEEAFSEKDGTQTLLEQWQADKGEMLGQLEQHEKVIESLQQEREEEIRKLKEDHVLQINNLKEDLGQSHYRNVEDAISTLKRELQTDSKEGGPLFDVKQQLRTKSIELEETKLKLTEALSKLSIQNSLKSQIVDLKRTISEKDKTIKKLKIELQDSADIQQTTVHQQVDSLKNILSLKDQEIGELNHRLEKLNFGAQSDQFEVSSKLRQCQKQLETCEKQKLDSLQAFQTSECEHRKIVNSYRAKIKEQHEKLGKMDRKMKNMEKYAHEQIDNLQESMEKEHSMSMEKMSSKLSEFKKKHVATVEALHRQHKAELEQKKQTPRAQMVTTPTQTDAALEEVRDRYVDIVNRMRVEVMQHVSESNERAAYTVREEVVKERQASAKRLKKYCMRSLDHFLENDTRGFNKTDLMKYMENALDNVPERDSSGSRNTSTGPLSSLSGSATPTEELLNTSSKQQAVASSTPRLTASKPPSSKTRPSNAQVDFDFARRGEEEFHKTRDRQRRKSSRSSENCKGRVSFETDLSVATPGVPPLDLKNLTSSTEVTPVSSSNTTPMDSPRYGVLVRQDLTNAKYHHRSSSAPKTVSKYSGSSALPHSKSATLHANISNRSKDSTNVNISSSKKFYDMDMKHFEATVMAAETRPPVNPNLMRVNSETYISTPEMPRYEDSPVRGSTSLNDIKCLLDEIESSPNPHSTRTELELSPAVIHNTVTEDYGRFGKYNSPSKLSRDKQGKSKTSNLFNSEIPIKYQSLPNVADATVNNQSYEDQYKDHNTTDHGFLQTYDNSSYYQPLLRQESTDSLLSDNVPESYKVVDRYKRGGFPRRHRHLDESVFHIGAHFKDSVVDLNVSDSDSVKSFASTSSITSFRQALSAKVNTRHQGTQPSRSQPMRIPVSHTDDILSHASNHRSGNPQAIQRPVPMVTRHTQMPSPGPAKLPRSKQM